MIEIIKKLVPNNSIVTHSQRETENSIFDSVLGKDINFSRLFPCPLQNKRLGLGKWSNWVRF